MLAQPRNGAGEYQVLRQRIQPGDVDDVHAAVDELPPGEVVHLAIVGDQSLGAGADVAEAVANLPDGGHVMRAPHFPASSLHLEEVEDRTEEHFEVGKT